MINILNYFLSKRMQRVVFNGCYVTWIDICTIVQQESIIRSLLFLKYINHLSKYIKSKWKLFLNNPFLVSVDRDTLEDNIICEKRRLT